MASDRNRHDAVGVLLAAALAATVLAACNAGSTTSTPPSPITITSPHDGDIVPTNVVKVKGTAPAGSTLQTIQADGSRGTVLVDDNGSWQTTWIFMDEGPHSITFQLDEPQKASVTLHVTYVPGPLPTRTPVPEWQRASIEAALIDAIGYSFKEDVLPDGTRRSTGTRPGGASTCAILGPDEHPTSVSITFKEPSAGDLDAWMAIDIFVPGIHAQSAQDWISGVQMTALSGIEDVEETHLFGYLQIQVSITAPKSAGDEYQTVMTLSSF
jgi:hypothetical protein